jgi:hypothetical protein
MKHGKTQVVGWLSLILGYAVALSGDSPDLIRTLVSMMLFVLAGVCFVFLVTRPKGGGPLRPA